MFARLRTRLTYANVIASVALFMAMSGTGYALSLPKASVGAKQLKRGAVTAKKVKNASRSATRARSAPTPLRSPRPGCSRGISV